MRLLCTLGHTLSGRNSETKHIINIDVCDKVLYMLNFDGNDKKCKNISPLKDQYCMIANITDKVISSNIFPKLIILLENERNL